MRCRLCLRYGFPRRGIAPIATATGQLTAASVIMLPIMLVLDQPWTLPPPPFEVSAAVVALAVVSTVLAYTIYYRILSTAGSVNLILVTFLIPATAILLGFLILGERLTLGNLFGMAAIGLGLAFIDGRPINRFRRVPSAQKTR